MCQLSYYIRQKTSTEFIGYEIIEKNVMFLNGCEANNDTYKTTKYF